MLNELCGYLRNYFEEKIYAGDFTITSGIISGNDMDLLENQYIRIVGSRLNDGVYKYKSAGITGLSDEAFSGAVWSLAIPKEVVAIDAEIDAWQAKYGGVDSAAMSPFSSESFGGYSYTKAQGFASTGGGMLTDWQSLFASRLSQWRKI